ncbi:MAG TPA: hypothetical protein VNA13_02475 [Xanthomonadales bacterium]|nr:hypothetical protein [Xanthomonadales bacterium]
MATVVNNPQTESSSHGMGFLLGVILLVVVAVLVIAYGLPALSGNAGTQVNLPNTVNVQPK